MIYGRLALHDISSISLLLCFLVFTPMSLALAQEKVVTIVPNALDKAKIQNSNQTAEMAGSTPFDPDPLPIAVGETVTWINKDNVPHTVTSGTIDPLSGGVRPDGKFDSGHIKTNESFSYTFDTKGIFSYFDTLNPQMVGQIHVDQDIEQRDESDRDESSDNLSAIGGAIK